MFAGRNLTVAVMVLALALAGMLAERSVFAGPSGPASIHPGDTVTINTEGARFMVGHEALATLGQGQTLKVLRVQEGWVGATVQMHGKAVSGWVRAGQVMPGSSLAQRGTARRSFSYEPGSQPVYRSYGRSRGYRNDVPNYLRMKTDPRKYEW